MKRILAIVLICSLIFAFAGCFGLRPEQAKADIFKLVQDNYDAILTACEGNDSQALLAIDGVTKVNSLGRFIIVYCKGAGIAPSSQDYGFYYSTDDAHIGVGCGPAPVCTQDKMQPKGNGYEAVINGNVFYTERIQGKIYFYSTAY